MPITSGILNHKVNYKIIPAHLKRMMLNKIVKYYMIIMGDWKEIMDSLELKEILFE